MPRKQNRKRTWRLASAEQLEARLVLDGSQVLTSLVAEDAHASTLVPDASFAGLVGADWISPLFEEDLSGEAWTSGPNDRTGIGFDLGIPELDTSNVYAWYDAASPDSINGPGADSDNDAISILADVSGNGRDLVRAGGVAEQPTYQENRLNGQPAIHFDGGDYIWGDATTQFGTLSQPNTVVAVTKVDVANGAYLYDSTASAGRNAVLTRNGGIVSWHMFAGGLVIGDPADLQLDQWEVHTYVFDGPASQHYINGELKAAGDVGTQDLRGLMLGARFSLNFRLTGDVAEFIVFDQALASADRAAAESYLMQKWLQGGGTSTYDDLINTNIEADMLGTNSSAYVRIPFSVANAQFDNLSVNVQYDDGFVAYLNGVEVARRNAPGTVGTTPSFDATATSVRPKTSAIVSEEIDISQHIGLLVEGADNLLAIQGLNIHADDSDFLILPTLVGANDPLQVVATMPVDGEFLAAPPTSIRVDFSLPVDAASVQASDLRVDGVSATAITMVDEDTFEFTVAAVSTGGIHEVTIPAGTITATNGQLIQIYTGTFVLPIAATVESLPPAVVGANFVDAQGEITATGGQNPNVTVYYGPSDGGNVAGNWQSRLDLGVLEVGIFSGHISQLASSATYYYRFFASNAAGDAWASTSQSFTTLPLPGVAITEFLASNENGLFVDEDGDDSDWVEIRNPGPAAIDLSGWFLTDENDDLTKWRFPSHTLSAGDYVVVFASGKDRVVSGNELHTNFQLSRGGDFLALVQDDGTTIATEFGSAEDDYPEQLSDVSYGLTEDVLAGFTGIYYMTEPTPGAVNNEGLLGFIGDTSFSVDRGFYSAVDLQPGGILADGVAISTSVDAPAGMQIIYTTDGSVPALGSPGTTLYAGPIRISATTTLRAMALADGYIPTNVDTHTYLFTEDVLQQDGAGLPALTATDYVMDPNIVDDPRFASLEDDLKTLPTVSFVLPVEDIFGPQGIIENPTRTGRAWEREASVEMIFADGRNGFQENAGLRIQGAGSRARAWSKNGFQLFFRGEYGAKQLEFPFFGPDGADTFDRIAFRGNFFDSWTFENAGSVGTSCCGYNQAILLRDQFGHLTHEDMGALAIDGSWVHLYINGQYWGVYNPIERPDAQFAETYLGGNAEDYDVLKQRPRGQANGSPPEVVQGDLAAWNELMTLINQDITTDLVYDQVAALMDLEDFADYIMLNVYGGNFDWPHNNWYAIRERTANAKWTFISWDAENFIFDVNADRSDVNTNNSPGIIFDRLRRNEEFRLLFADRVQEHFFNEGALTPDANIERFEVIANEMRAAMNAESARWGNTHVEPPRNTIDHWEVVIQNKIDNYFPRRSDIVLDQFRADGLFPQIAAPIFQINGTDKHGGNVDAGDLLGMTAIVDEVFEETVLLAQGSPALAFVPSDASLETGDEPYWYDPELDASQWIAGTNGVGYEDNASGYATLIGTDVRDAWNATESSVYTRFEFMLDASFDSSSFESAVLRMKYDDGFVAILNGAELVRVNAPATTDWQSNSTLSHPDAQAVNFEEFEITDYIHVLNPGFNLLAIHGLNLTDTSSDLLVLPELVVRNRVDVTSAPIYFTTDGTDPRADNGEPIGTLFATEVPLDETTQVTARTYVGGAWSALSQAVFTPPGNLGSVIMSEINYNPAAPTTTELAQIPDLNNDDFEFIEVVNVRPSRTINVVNWSLQDGVTFTFPHVTLAPGERAVIVEDIAAFRLRYGDEATILGQWNGGLSNSGETVELRDLNNQLLQSTSYDDTDPWPAAADGAGATLELVEPIRTTRLDKYYQWRFSTEFGGSPGQAGAEPIGIVINEVRSRTDLNPADVDAIELYNTGDATVDISGWYLSDSEDDLLKFRIPDGTTLEPGVFIVFDAHEFNPTPDTPGPKDFGLSGSSGDDVWLVTSADGVNVTSFVDHVQFGASINGGTLGRVPNGNGRFVPTMRSSLGCQNGLAHIGDVIISEVNYNPAFSFADFPELSGSAAEYLEITNVTLDSLDLAGWRIQAGVEFEIPANTVLASMESLVIISFNPTNPSNTERLSQFRTLYDVAPGTQIVGGYQGGLSGNFDLVRLERPDIPPPDDPDVTPYVSVDEVLYDDKSPWPVRADGVGQSLTRLAPTFYGHDNVSWVGADYSPGRVDFSVDVVPGDLTGDGLVDALDIDLLFNGVHNGTRNAYLVLQGEAPADIADVELLVHDILGTSFGDANLDGAVDGSDFNIWNNNKFQSCNKSWSQGDFTGDGSVDGSDFNRWFDNRFQSPAAKAADIGDDAKRVPREPLNGTGTSRPAASDALLVDAAFAERGRSKSPGALSADEIDPILESEYQSPRDAHELMRYPWRTAQWESRGRVIVRDGDFPDDDRTSDHRPVEFATVPR